MYVVHARSKADDFALIDGNRQMVSVIAQEVRHEGGLEVVVEHLRRDVVENRDISAVRIRTSSNGSLAVRLTRQGP